MLRVTDIVSTDAIYAYHSRLAAPNFFETDEKDWKKSFEEDVDGAGRRLFRHLQGKAAYDGERIVGFIQYGITDFGFDEKGEISDGLSCSVIRALYFERDREDAGELLLQAAMEELRDKERTYAFFHYFGMSCYARHGKLFEKFPWVERLLCQHGFAVEHENVYYSSELRRCARAEIELQSGRVTKGNHQSFDFLLEGNKIGGCEVHYVGERIVYLRWIYVNDSLQNRGLGSECMTALKCRLFEQGFARLDTDTALNNRRAQHFYEKNGFCREGLTRSFWKTLNTEDV